MANVILAASAVNAKLVDAPKEVKLAVQELLSYNVEGRTPTSFSDGKWSGRSSFFDFNTGVFPAGFTSLVLAKLQQGGHTVRLVKKPLPAPLGPGLPIVDAFGHSDARYDYQMQVVNSVERHGQVIAQVATGGGKSRIAKLAFKRIGRKTLFLTTRGILMYQMATSVRAMGDRVGILGDGEWNPNAEFCAGMVQTFTARLREPTPEASDSEWVEWQRRCAETAALLETFEFVILEEAHESSSASYSDIMRLCKNAHYRLALTATPFMKDSQEANMRLMACSGPVAIRVSEKTLIDRGILAKPYFKFIRIEERTPAGGCERKDPNGKSLGIHPATQSPSMPWPKCYEIGVTHGVKRNGIIVYEAKRAVEHGLTVMVLVHQQRHGENLRRLFTEAGVRCAFIFGKHEQDERAAAIGALKSGKIDVLIGSTILDVGVDIPAVGMVIIASAGKAEVGTRQRIGRGLREKRNGAPNLCFIIDFDDWQNKTLREHTLQRQTIIRDTEGFVEGILAPGADFDYSPFRKAA